MIEIAEESQKKVQTALLIGVRTPGEDENTVREHLDELAELVRTLDIEPLEERPIANAPIPQAQYYVGTGKAEEIWHLSECYEADCLVFDIPLSPSQQRNWERLTHNCVIDREEVILDIFAERASTREAVLQIELARAQYSLPRLTRAWTHLSRQHGGGATTRGEGETQIETDRRLLRRRIQQLESDLEKVRKQRDTQRKSRGRGPLLHGAIVGYTNVGKSSLLKALSNSEVLVRDQLFATLDPTTRRIAVDDRTELLLTDTVGFVRKLPHSLVEAFKSTLEEAVLADFLLLILDISSPHLDEQWETTLQVLRELGAEDKNIVVVFNKTDLVNPKRDAVLLARLKGLFPDALYASVKTPDGLDSLRKRLTELAAADRRVLQLKLPPDRYDLAALAHAKGKVYEETCDDCGNLLLTIGLDERLHHRFKEYCL